MRAGRPRRRDVVTLLGGAAAFGMRWPLSLPLQLPLAVHAQPQAMPVVGFLHPASPEPFPHIIDGFRRGLSDAGFVEGQNVAIEYRWARGEYERLPALAAELVRLRVRVILAGGGEVGALAAKAATSTIPILIITSSDPVQSGLVASFNRPGGNVTGRLTATSILEAKKLGLLCEMVPDTRLVAMLINPSYPPHAADAVQVQSAAQSIGRQLLVLRADSPAAIDAAFASLVEQRAGALQVGGDPFLTGRSRQVIALAARHAIPTIYDFRESVLAGGLMSYGSSLPNNYRQLGAYAARILKGEAPADLPVMYPALFDFAINLVTAKTLGLTVPPMLLARADEVVE
jgi:putative tryptophan/tyrosine transport system substrate-binding protein